MLKSVSSSASCISVSAYISLRYYGSVSLKGPASHRLDIIRIGEVPVYSTVRTYNRPHRMQLPARFSYAFYIVKGTRSHCNIINIIFFYPFITHDTSFLIIHIYGCYALLKSKFPDFSQFSCWLF